VFLKEEYMKKIRSIGTTRDSLKDRGIDISKLLGAEPCGVKINTKQNPLSRYVLRKHINDKIKNK